MRDARKPFDVAAKARLLVRDIQRALKECDVAKAERLAREQLELSYEHGRNAALDSVLEVMKAGDRA